MPTHSIGHASGLLLLVLVACRPGPPPTVTDRPAGLTLDPIDSIPLDGSIRRNLAWIDSTHLVVLGEDASVLLLGPTGIERRVGRRGEGPGEYHFPFDVDLASDGTILVLDGFGRRIQRLDHELRPIDRRTTPKFVNEIVGHSGDTLALMWQVFPADSLGRTAGFLVPGNDSVRGTWRFGAVDPVFSDLVDIEDRSQGPSPYLILRADGRFVLAEGRDYHLWLLDRSGRVLGRGGRPELEADREVVSPEEIAAEVARARGRTPEPALADQAEQVIRRRYAAPRYRIRRMATAPDGTLWVLGDRGGLDSTRVDLFAPDLKYLGTTTIRGEAWGIALWTDRVAFLIGDQDEEQWRVARWRYAWH